MIKKILMLILTLSLSLGITGGAFYFIDKELKKSNKEISKNKTVKKVKQKKEVKKEKEYNNLENFLSDKNNKIINSHNKKNPDKIIIVSDEPTPKIKSKWTHSGYLFEETTYDVESGKMGNNKIKGFIEFDNKNKLDNNIRKYKIEKQYEDQYYYEIVREKQK